jgi:hypothetical protein
MIPSSTSRFRILRIPSSPTSGYSIAIGTHHQVCRSPQHAYQFRSNSKRLYSYRLKNNDVRFCIDLKFESRSLAR